VGEGDRGWEPGRIGGGRRERKGQGKAGNGRGKGGKREF